MHNFEQLLQHILSESARLTADAQGAARATLCDMREQQIAGMVSLAVLLWLPASFIEALDEHRYALVDEATRCRAGR
ncbi:MAG: hypothetical protein EPO27_20555 [Betaproteobacteria bacterium]|nr:MAG: hypothetical protein EPO27_20555 [Betaproteobacteria bacterium]